MLFTLYVFLDYVKEIIEGYVGFSSVFYISVLIEQILTDRILAATGIKSRDKHWATADWMESEWLGGNYSFTEAVSIFISFVIVLAWYITRLWFLNNLIGICMGITFLKIA